MKAAADFSRSFLETDLPILLNSPCPEERKQVVEIKYHNLREVCPALKALVPQSQKKSSAGDEVSILGVPKFIEEEPRKHLFTFRKPSTMRGGNYPTYRRREQTTSYSTSTFLLCV
ncbi:hypothetical protein ENBRE01_3343 [Enteropsectra breve]|nr:hypothetical protein ENBRE01_3343 [Enteropsectra breve]